MKIYYIGNNAFADLGGNYLLCIGTVAEVETATPERLVDLIWDAVVISRFNEAETQEHKVH